MLVEEPCGDEIPPADSNEDDVFVNFSFLQVSRSHAPKRSNVVNLFLILLDSKSTVCNFSNAKHVENIHPHEKGKNVRIHTNRGTQLSSNMAGYIRLMISMWFNHESITDISYFASVKKLYRVTMDSTEGVAMHVHISPTDIMSFLETPNGMYYHDTSKTNLFTHKP